jgi:hypothetical protein
MTDTAKAVAFATYCLKWTDVSIAPDTEGLRIFGKRSGGTPDSFNPDSMWELQEVLTEFLGNHYFIQINRGTGSLFHWRVIVGLQDRSVKGAGLDNAQAEGEDLWDAVFDACVAAARMDNP